jgi:ribosomal protein S18 acetylase RimI-like enzyme
VRELCARIWSDDYVPLVFRAWTRDRRGRCWVAVEDGRVVAVAKLTISPSREAWLHGLRVHPDYRRRGIATALLEHRLSRARQLGARVARLDTSEDNVAIHRLARRYGFRRIARTAYYETRASGAERPRAAEPSEIDAVWRLMRVLGGMIYESHFARRMVRDDVAAAIRERRCFVSGPVGHPTAAALTETLRSEHGSRLLTRVLAGSPAKMRSLLLALRGEAKARRLSRAGIAAPSELWRSVTAAGYRRRWPETMFVFEREL